MLQPARYRWLARLVTAARESVQVSNRLGRPGGVGAIAPDDTVRASPLLGFTPGAGLEETFAIPLGLPLAMRHGVLVFDGAQQIAAGRGDDVRPRADGQAVPA